MLLRAVLRIAATAVACLALIAVVGSVAGHAFATGSEGKTGAMEVDQPLRVELSAGEVSLGWHPIHFVSPTTSPASIQVGVACGMNDACGLKPCLCGSAVDHWGACACNGLRTARPTFKLDASDGSVVRTVRLAGAYLLYPTGTGRTTVMVRGSLPNLGAAQFQLTVQVTKIGLVLFWVVVALIVLAALAVIAGLVFALTRGILAVRAPRNRADGRNSPT